MSGEKIMVVGGAGYVGSHTCLALKEAGFTPVVLDNFSNGHQEFVQFGPFAQVDILDKEALLAAFLRHKPAAIIHFAALIEVGISMKSPMDFYQTNVGGALNVIAAARASGAVGMVFSSTCATYGNPEYVPLDEAHKVAPLNPYGWSKAMVERTLEDIATLEGWPSVRLRYFNAAGADPLGRLGEKHEPETHAIPLLLEWAQGKRDPFTIFGTDYDTKDGTAVRDYIHVLDLADAHVRAVRHLLSGGKADVFNLGTGTGTSVLELIAAAEVVTGVKLTPKTGPRRAGDSPILVANPKKAADILGWKARRGLNDILADAWAWHTKYDLKIFGPKS